MDRVKPLRRLGRALAEFGFLLLGGIVVVFFSDLPDDLRFLVAIGVIGLLWMVYIPRFFDVDGEGDTRGGHETVRSPEREQDETRN